MKGQRLFVRTAGPSDLEELQSFYRIELSEHGSSSGTSPLELHEDLTHSIVGKLVGDLVAHFRFTRAGDSLILRSMYVARLLRRKRIGRLMISELARLAGRDGAVRIIAPAGCDADRFLRSCGFETSDEGSLTMKIDSEEEP